MAREHGPAPRPSRRAPLRLREPDARPAADRAGEVISRSADLNAAIEQLTTSRRRRVSRAIRRLDVSPPSEAAVTSGGDVAVDRAAASTDNAAAPGDVRRPA